MNQNEQMRELEAKVRSQANLIKAMEQTQRHLLSQQANWEEATRTLESEREANRILTEELEQAKQALPAKPAPLVRLTDELLSNLEALHIRVYEGLPETYMVGVEDFANAIMDEMIAKNGGKV